MINFEHFQVESFVLYYVAFWKPLAYAVLFLAMILEGEIFVFAAAFLASRGFIDPEITFLVLFAGVQIGDSLWYWLGYKINHSDTRFGRWLVSKTGRFDEHLTSNPLRTIFFSKFFIGIHHFILARAGVLKVRYREFLKDDFLANVAWLAVVGGLGYASGASYDLVKHNLKFVEYSLLIGLVVFLALDYLLVRSLKKKI